jgi:hypothetical protein
LAFGVSGDLNRPLKDFGDTAAALAQLARALALPTWLLIRHNAD